MSKKWLALLLLLIAGGIAGWWLLDRKGGAVDEAPDPRLTYPTRFRNVRPDVQFVGDDACAKKCHSGHAASYRDHPMGRSLLPISQATSIENYDGSAKNTFTAIGFDYRVERRGEHVWHTERRLRPDGQ